jgi:mRNA-degrading endonuclease RelE of RelBE toxin-antitoxin system
MKFELEAIPEFEKEYKKLSKKYPSLKSELLKLFDSLVLKPNQGISLGKDYFKIRLRISSKNRGKSGGARIITCVKVILGKVYLVALYDKAEIGNIISSEIENRLSKTLQQD